MRRARSDTNHDPYRRCEQQCNHDLGRGVSIAELLGIDGPFPDPVQIFAMDRPRSRNRSLVRPGS
jgi:hypothetical protein